MFQTITFSIYAKFLVYSPFWRIEFETNLSPPKKNKKKHRAPQNNMIHWKTMSSFLRGQGRLSCWSKSSIPHSRHPTLQGCSNLGGVGKNLGFCLRFIVDSVKICLGFIHRHEIRLFVLATSNGKSWLANLSQSAYQLSYPARDW